MAVICATLLIALTQRGAFNQLRASVGHENLSGYFQLYGTLFQTLKQTRRDLLQGSGVFTFDSTQSTARVQQALDHIKTTTRADADLLGAGRKDYAFVRLVILGPKVLHAMDGIEEASGLIAVGKTDTQLTQPIIRIRHSAFRA